MSFDRALNPSLCLARLLDRIIGTEEEVCISRELIRIREYCGNINRNFTYIYTGSIVEGSALKSSDIDYMSVNHDVIVLDSVPIDVDHLMDKEILLMRRDRCQPGYVILQVLRQKIPIHNDAYTEWNNYNVLSSILLRDEFNNDVICNPNGPCITSKVNGKNYDSAYCFEFKDWPREAFAFFKRPRQNGWPSRQLLDIIKCKGCHLVAVGDKTSDLVNIQWRVSFAVVEKMLVHSFNHTQLRVYVLMKIFHQQVIETYNEVKDLLCSYFIKTTMFYMIENTDPLIWREDNIIKLFGYCFMKLADWVEDGYCPNYFIPENNLFKRKIYGQNRNNLLKVFNGIKQEGWKSIYRCNCLKGLQKQSFNIKLLALSTDMKHHESQRDLLQFCACDIGFDNAQGTFPVDQALRRVLGLFNTSSTSPRKEINMLISRVLLGEIGLHLLHDAKHQQHLHHRSRNKETYKSMRNCERLLLEGAKVDISRGPLNLALFYYALKQYRNVIQICNKVLSNITPSTIFYGDNSIPESYKETFCGRGIGVVQKMRKAVALDVVVKPSCKRIYPKELQHDIKASKTCSIFYPPVPFAIFLKFLCHHVIGNTNSRLSALRDLKRLVHGNVQGKCKYPLVLNLLAICLDKVGDTSGAIEACRRSQQLQPQLNGASKIINEFSSRI